MAPPKRSPPSSGGKKQVSIYQFFGVNKKSAAGAASKKTKGSTKSSAKQTPPPPPPHAKAASTQEAQEDPPASLVSLQQQEGSQPQQRQHQNHSRSNAASNKTPAPAFSNRKRERKRRRDVLVDTDDEEEKEWNGKEEEKKSEGNDDSDFEMDDNDGGADEDCEYDEEKDGVTPKRRKVSTAGSGRRTSSSGGRGGVPPSASLARTNTSGSNGTSAEKAPSLSGFARVTPVRTPLAQASPATTTTAAVSTSTAGSSEQPPLPTRLLHSKSPSPAAAATAVSSTTSSAEKPKVPKPVKGALNPIGSHVHNHLRFLQNPRDASGKTPDHPDYDGRTLTINLQEYERVTGSKITPAVQQWWELKSQYFDTLLLFKAGKFYEMYQCDAYVAVRVLGILLMKGEVAKAGFPEKSYGAMADKLVRAGYKVARVEQTETQQMLDARKKQNRGKGTAPKVMCREVCSIMTLGTRTCSHLDVEPDESNVMAMTQSYGPLLVVAERKLVPQDGGNGSEPNSDANAALVREFGVTLIEAGRGWVTLGQFQDDVLCSHLQTLLAAYAPSEILYQQQSLEQDDNDEVAPRSSQQTLKSLFAAHVASSMEACRVEVIRSKEVFPKSTALDAAVRDKLQRHSPTHPWDVSETLGEVHRRNYFAVDGNGNNTGNNDMSSWPDVLRAAAQNATANELALSSFGAALYYIQRNLIDAEILSMRVVKEYSSPTSTFLAAATGTDGNGEQMKNAASSASPMGDAMALSGTALHSLEVIANINDNKVAGSLWSRINDTKTPHGSRLLKAWLLRPLFDKVAIDRRAEAVQELASGGAAVVAKQARDCLKKCGDIERLLSRVHSMSGPSSNTNNAGTHPDERAVMYEEQDYTRRKVGDFSKVLNGLRQAAKIPLLFRDLDISSGLLSGIVNYSEQGGMFPDCRNEIEWFYDNCDLDLAAKGQFEPSQGVDAIFDQANADIERIKRELDAYKDEMGSQLRARSSWKYINTKAESKDKYLIELPASVQVPDDWQVKGKRGKGAKQVNKYMTPEVAELVQELEASLETVADRRSCAVQLIFAKFDTKRDLWAAVAQATAILDALCSLAQLAQQPGYTRPEILEYQDKATISFRQARHPCVDGFSSEFIPNDLALGTEQDPERVLLLSGPNMGGKSTFLRQTCILTILAQIGSFVPAEEVALTPVDSIYTRLGASDRILLGQSTFFVELSENASALRGATSRSLVIMDELGRGTSTFDGTAIASATIKSLVERNKCLALFATHYHNLLEDWNSHPLVRLGHMECLVEQDNEEVSSRVTFLYTLGRGACPNSFGVNCAEKAGLPKDVIVKAGNVSAEFAEKMNTGYLRTKVENAIQSGNWALLVATWQQAQKAAGTGHENGRFMMNWTTRDSVCKIFSV